VLIVQDNQASSLTPLALMYYYQNVVVVLFIRMHKCLMAIYAFKLDEQGCAPYIAYIS
jgi:hypothetical protein